MLVDNPAPAALPLEWHLMTHKLAEIIARLLQEVNSTPLWSRGAVKGVVIWVKQFAL